MRYSIIRRSSGFTIAFLAGHAFNYALLWGSNRILNPTAFGVFYTAFVTITVAMSPMMAATIVLARQFAEVGAKAGHQLVATMTWRVITPCIRAAPIAVIVGAVLAAAAPWFGIQGWQVVLLIPITVLALVVVEIIRASLQSMLLFARASALWVVGTGIECLISLAALHLFAAVWTGIAGLLAGGVLVSAVCLPWFAAAARRQGAASTPPVHVRREIPMIVSYSLFILFNNVDMLLGYWLLPQQELGRYAASALLPKAIIAATFAVAQVVLPVVTEQRTGGLSFRVSAVKGIVMAGVAAVFAAALLRFVMPFIQRTPFAIRGFDFELMGILAIAAVALSIVRVLVVIEVALHRYAVGLAQIAAFVPLVVLCASIHTNALRLAGVYSITSVGFLLLSCGIVAASWIRPSWWMRLRFGKVENGKS